jgi:hypothetical protein
MNVIAAQAADQVGDLFVVPPLGGGALDKTRRPDFVGAPPAEPGTTNLSSNVQFPAAEERSWEKVSVRFGLVLSGEKLVDNLDFREQLRVLEPEAIGGEMEGAGLYVACHDAKVDWILVKAICDWVDGHKNRNKTKRQALAAHNAARFVLHVLQQAPLKLKRTTQQAGADDESSDPASVSTMIIQHGSGGVAVGTKAVVAGERGVAIGGDASSCTIVTGDGNSIHTQSRPQSKPKGLSQ